jgi:hypothetical protein
MFATGRHGTIPAAPAQAFRDPHQRAEVDPDATRDGFPHSGNKGLHNITPYGVI